MSLLSNDSDIKILYLVLWSCIFGLVRFRIFQADMIWDKKDKIRPLWFKDRKTGAARDNVAHCENSAQLFDYEKEFNGKKKRTIIVINL